MKKYILLLTILYCTVIFTGSALILTNDGGTGLYIKPSQELATYSIPTSIKSTTPIIVESKYVYISDTPVWFSPSSPTTYQIYDFKPEDKTLSNAIIFNYTSESKDQDSYVEFRFGNLANMPFLVYKDNKLWYTAISYNDYRFVGDNISIDSYDTLIFYDGNSVKNEIVNSITPLSNAQNYDGYLYVYSGVVQQVYTDENSGYTMFLIDDNTGTMTCVYPATINIPKGTTVYIYGAYDSKYQVIFVYAMYFDTIFDGSMDHTYTVRVPDHYVLFETRDEGKPGTIDDGSGSPFYLGDENIPFFNIGVKKPYIPLYTVPSVLIGAIGTNPPFTISIDIPDLWIFDDIFKMVISGINYAFSVVWQLMIYIASDITRLMIFLLLLVLLGLLVLMVVRESIKERK